MSCSGDTGPCLTSELIALDRFNKEQNKKYAPEIFAFYKEQLGIEYSKYVCKYRIKLMYNKIYPIHNDTFRATSLIVKLRFFMLLLGCQVTNLNKEATLVAVEAKYCIISYHRIN